MHYCALRHGIKDSIRSTSNRKDFLTPFSDDRTTNKNPFIVMDLQPSRDLYFGWSNLRSPQGFTFIYFERSSKAPSPPPCTPRTSTPEARRASLLITSSAARKLPQHRTVHTGRQPRSPKGFTSSSPERSSGLNLHQNPNLHNFTTHLCEHLFSFS